jgi:4a-hydroxytetrahydrobiopterin dehydratase
VTRPPRLDDASVDAWLAGHPRWRLEQGHLVRDLATSDYPSAVAIAHAQVALAERLDHHPLLTIGYRQLRVELWTHDRAGLTELDLDYAAAFDVLVSTSFADAVED